MILEIRQHPIIEELKSIVKLCGKIQKEIELMLKIQIRDNGQDKYIFKIIKTTNIYIIIKMVVFILVTLKQINGMYQHQIE